VAPLLNPLHADSSDLNGQRSPVKLTLMSRPPQRRPRGAQQATVAEQVEDERDYYRPDGGRAGCARRRVAQLQAADEGRAGDDGLAVYLDFG
jgi:hypothetical protein